MVLNQQRDGHSKKENIAWDQKLYIKGVFTWENSHRREFQTGMTFLISHRVYMMTGSFHILLFNDTFHVDKIHVWYKIANITHALPVPVYRQTDFTPKWLVFRVYMIPLRDFAPEWNSRPGARTGVNSRRGDSRRHSLLWWYHVNKYRAMRGNRSELAPGRKSPRCHVNTPLVS